MLLLVKGGVQDPLERNETGVVKTRSDLLISLLLDHLSKHEPARMPSLTSLARAFNLSASHLRHVIKKTTGMSYGRYIKTLRLRRARQLLQETFCSVKQVMSEVGFVDHSHFARDYKKEFGESPTETRWSSIAASGKKPSSEPPNSHSGHKQALAMRAGSR